MEEGEGRLVVVEMEVEEEGWKGGFCLFNFDVYGDKSLYLNRTRCGGRW